MDAHIEHLNRKACDNLMDLEKRYTDVQSADGYEQLSLSDRLALRKNLESIIAAVREHLGSYRCEPT